MCGIGHPYRELDIESPSSSGADSMPAESRLVSPAYVSGPLILRQTGAQPAAAGVLPGCRVHALGGVSTQYMYICTLCKLSRRSARFVLLTTVRQLHLISRRRLWQRSNTHAPPVWCREVRYSLPWSRRLGFIAKHISLWRPSTASGR